MKQDIQMRNMVYKDLQSDKRIANADIHGERIANPLERVLSLFILLMLCCGGIEVRADNFEGIWYIANDNSSDKHPGKDYSSAALGEKYYLVPAAEPQQPSCIDAYYSPNHTTTNGDPEKPFLTTKLTSQDLNSIWIITASGETDYYFIIHAITGKYVIYEVPLPNDPNYNNKANETQNGKRKTMHLQTPDNGDYNLNTNDKFKFKITTNGTGYNICPKSRSGWYWNPAGQNSNYYCGQQSKETPDLYRNGLVGVYNNAGTNSIWHFEDASSATTLTPVISDVDGSTNTFTITSPAAAFSSIRYTTDGTTTPNASNGNTVASGTPVTITSTMNVQAVGVFSTFVTPVAGPKELSPVAPPPTISYNYTTTQVTISSATALSYYYTIDGSTPTTDSTPYNNTPFSVTTPTTVKAIAIYPGNAVSAVAELAISQVATPTIQNNGNNAISITTTTPGATIYYTTDGTDPTTSSTKYTNPLTDNVSKVTIKAIAVKEGMITSEVGSGSVILQCATPVITRKDMTFSLSCSMPTNATFYYSLDGSTPATLYSGPISFTSEQLPKTVTAMAKHDDYTDSGYATFELKNGQGTPLDPYLIYGDLTFADFVSAVNGGTTSACYKLEVDVSGSGVEPITTAFTGTFDGDMHTISNLGHALFNTINGGTVKNVMLDNVRISSGTNVGAICNEATGASRIYNCGVLATGSTVTTDDEGYTNITSCSSSVSGSGYVGGIVGRLDGSSRVINCFSYANITGGSNVGGIVGYNNYATTSNTEKLKTMVMNCMFYGDITGGTNKAPIYNGKNIVNKDANGVGNYNYFCADASYVQNNQIDTYNCALVAETRYLQRFEFFRHLLNSHRELAAWWASTSTTTVTKDEMMKWVMEPSQIGTTTPYPILKSPGKYASVVNYTPNETAYDDTHRNEGRKLTNVGDNGVLHVTIDLGTNGGSGAQFSAPSGAGFKEGEDGIFDLTITDKDFEHFNFNYGKVQLPYYNDYCDGNYTGNRVVTGWKITSITGGTQGSYTTDEDATADTNGNITATPYNFADRKCTDKDLYSVSGRVFNQGAYWDVPEGVTGITIQPYWGKAVYLADAYADVVYNTSMGTPYNVPNVGGGQLYNNGVSEFNEQFVYTSISDAIASSGSALYSGIDEETRKSHTVYDYAVVLVGNYHHITDISAYESKPYTVTSVDLDGDNEPDYSFMLRFDSRKGFHPVRYDFLNLVGLGMAQKSTGGKGSYNFGILQPKYWFEVTNTALFRVTQMEYDAVSGRAAAPIILHGGVIEQWVSCQNKQNKVTYFHVGGNVWFKEFHLGCHQDKSDQDTKHPPVSVTGGDYDAFYLTGLYATTKNYDDNAECYINGGRFGTVAGAGMEGIGHATNHTNGNIVWQIDHADIKEFYGGGINAAKPIEGNITTVISNSHVDLFCGGPKFGDMNPGRTVTTTATNCTFGTYFGAGYGGNSYNRGTPFNFTYTDDINFVYGDDTDKGYNVDWNKWVKGEIKARDTSGQQNHGDYSNGVTYTGYNQEYISEFGGVSAQINYQFLPQSNNLTNVARLFIDFVSFSLATTHDVTSKLTGCTVTGNFYGGGSLGKVNGDVTSTLTDCTVNGSAFGAGYSATLPTVEVMNTGGFATQPRYDKNLGAFFDGEFPGSVTYRWEQTTAISAETAIDKTNHILYTTEDLTTLGTVTGDVSLTIGGTTTIDHDVYGGGESSAVGGSVEININNGTITQDVYGGGALADTNTGNATNYGETNETVGATDTNTTIVNLTGGTVMGDVYGGGKGQIGRAAVEAKEAVGTPGEPGYEPAVEAVEGIKDVPAMVYGDVSVTLNGTKLHNTTGKDDQDHDVSVSGRVFGCNNLNGWPKGDVIVTVEKTIPWSGDKHQKGTYDVAAVYGGGNLAKYEPANTANAQKTRVIINGCEDTSIYQVYGGGNAASTPATQVDINGTFEIEDVFGGGNGKDRIQKNGVWGANPGANVGYYEFDDTDPDYDTKEERTALGTALAYGAGATQVNVYGGEVHHVYGGSNTRGNVRRLAKVSLEEQMDGEDKPLCSFKVAEAYGGGKSAAMDGETQLEMKCIPGLDAVYGGSENADILNNVTLNITNGKYGQVFGGNNRGGRLGGKITVNVEETGCRPIIIGELYGGGNRAAYSVYGYTEERDENNDVVHDADGKIKWQPLKGGDTGALVTPYDDPEVNVKSFTSIGDIYGGGYGETAVMVGDPEVNINVVVGDRTNHDEAKIDAEGTITITEELTPGNTTTRDVKYPAHTKGKIGAINNIFGGGNAARVIGNPTVNVGTASSVTYVTKATGDADYRTFNTGIGADIRGNVYGGGNEADVTGDTKVNIGKENQ